jgi:hypothetical protein
LCIDALEAEEALASSWHTARKVASLSSTTLLTRSHSALISGLALAATDASFATARVHAASAAACACVNACSAAVVVVVRAVLDPESPAAELVVELLLEPPHPTSALATRARSGQMKRLRVIVFSL